MPLTIHALQPLANDYEHFIVWVKGGGDGVWRGVAGEALVEEQNTPSASVDVGAFSAQVSEKLVRVPSAVIGPVTFPTGGVAGDLRRIDLVQYTLNVGVNLIEGTEDAAPVAPSVSADSIALAHVYCKKGMSVVLNAEAGNDGYLVDQRVFV